MTTPVRLSMPIAFLIENLRTSGVSDDKLIQIIKNREFKFFVDQVVDPTMNFDERIQTAEELSEPWEEAIKEGYSFKFLHLNGLKKLLALRFNKSDGVDYSQQDHKLVGIHLSSSEEILLHELIQGSWTVTKSSNFITITPKY